MNVCTLKLEDSQLQQQSSDRKELCNSASIQQLDQVAFKGIRENISVDGERYSALNLLPILTAWQCSACWKIIELSKSGRKHITSCEK